MRRIVGPGVISLILILIVQACGGLKIDRVLTVRPGDWLMAGGDPARTNSTFMTLRPPLQERWRYDALAGIGGQPLVRDSVVFVGTLNGEVHAIQMRTGDRVGRKTLGVAIAGSPVLSGNLLIAASAKGEESLVGYDLTIGKIVWRASLDAIATSPILEDDHVYVATLDGTLCCLDAHDGSIVWKTETVKEEDPPDPIRSSPVLVNGVLACGTDRGVLLAADAETGRLLWRVDVGSSIFAGAVALDGKIIVGTIGGTLVCVDVRTGDILWRYDAKAPLYGAASGASGLVFVGSADGILHAIRLDNGTSAWTFATQSVINCAPFVSGEVLYVGSLDRKIYALDAATGTKLWQSDAAGRIKVSPVQWGSTLLVTSEDKYVTAFTP